MHSEHAGTITLFVYGTLKRGHCRAGALSGQRLLGTARTLSRYRLYDCGSYPGLVEWPAGLAIEGELWEVDACCLAELDAIEGVPENLYRRGRVLLAPPHDTIEALTYFFLPDVSGLRDCGTRW